MVAIAALSLCCQRPLGHCPSPRGLGSLPCPGAQAVSPGTGWCRVAGTTSGCGECGAEPCARVPSAWASTTPWSSPTWPSRRGPRRSRRTVHCKGLSLSPVPLSIHLPPLPWHFAGALPQNSAAFWSWERLSPLSTCHLPKGVWLLAEQPLCSCHAAVVPYLVTLFPPEALCWIPGSAGGAWYTSSCI